MDVSIIIPTYNRAAALANTLEGLGALSDATPEIIVVDNNSTDSTKEVTESFSCRSGRRVRYIFERTQGASYARNRGIEAANGEILVFIDDDMVVPAYWLTEMKKAFAEHGAACAGGKVLVERQAQLPAWWDERLLAPLSVFDLGNKIIVSNGQSKDVLATGGNCAVLRSVLERNGGFRTDIGRFGNKHGGGEDSELVLRLQRNGERVIYYPSALLYHAPDIRRFTPKSLPRFFYTYGITCCQIDLLFPQSGPQFAGIPRWKYRWLLQDSLRAFSRMLTSNSREAFYHRMSLYKNWGYAKALLKTKRSALLSANPQPVPQRVS